MRWYVDLRTTLARCLVIAAATVIAVCDSADPVPLSPVDDNSTGIVKVEVYYEALCYDSIRFVRDQLVPTYEQLGSHMEVIFIPYGKATHNKIADGNGGEKWVFECQHGSSECAGNKAQACGIKEILTNPERSNKQKDLVDFVGCVMSAQNPSIAVPTCLTNIGLDESRKALVQTCSSSSEGDELLAAYGDKTYSLRPNLSFVPTIVLNGKRSHEDQRNALRNLKRTICNLIPADSKPPVC